MRFNLIDDDTFVVKINSSYMILDDDSLYDKIKKILIDIRKRYHYDIYGFYDVDIFYVENFLTILKFLKKDSDDYFDKTIDLKITKHSKELEISFDDFDIFDINEHFFDKGKIKGSLFNKKDIIKYCEFYSFSDNLQY